MIKLIEQDAIRCLGQQIDRAYSLPHGTTAYRYIGVVALGGFTYSHARELLKRHIRKLFGASGDS